MASSTIANSPPEDDNLMWAMEALLGWHSESTKERGEVHSLISSCVEQHYVA